MEDGRVVHAGRNEIIHHGRRNGVGISQLAVVGRLVALAEEQGKPLNELSLAQLQSIDARFGPDALEVFKLKRAMAARQGIGAPGTLEVQRQLRRWQKILAS